jgi:hypothetical protein
MPSQIEQRYGVPLPIDALWRELEERYGAAAVADLRAIYRQATRRYTRAATLNQMRRNLANWDRQGVKTERAERYRAALADPQSYIDG